MKIAADFARFQPYLQNFFALNRSSSAPAQPEFGFISLKG
jgi:hypothetical protein